MNDIYQYIDEHRQEFVDDLLRLVSQPSVSATGEGIQEMAQVVKEYLAESGLDAHVESTEGNPVVLGTAKGTSERTLLIYNHYDVVPAEPIEAWTSPPFKPEVREGYLYGRGATDNKGNIVSRVAALKAWLRVRGELPIGIKYLIEGEEEVSSPNLAAWLRGNKDRLVSDGCLWEDTVGRIDVPLISLGNKGMCVIQFRCRTMPADVHSGLAAALPNAGWRLVHALASMKDEHGRVLVKGFYDAVAPIGPEHEALLEKLPPVSVWREAGINTVGGMRDEDVARAQVIDPTFNMSGFTAGYTGPGARGAVLATAEAKLDIRLVPDQDPEVIPQLIRKHLDEHGYSDIEMEVVSSPKWPSRSEVDTILNRALVASSLEVYGADPIMEPNQGGCTPMVLVQDILEIPVAATGVGHVNAATHGIDERINIDYLIEGIKYFATVFEQFARVDTP